MEFHTSPVPAPKNLYPCLVTITIGGSPGSRRSSFASGGDGEDSTLRRVISAGTGGRRKSSFGSSDKDKEGVVTKGEWYWRVQAGVDQSNLVLLALSDPPNPVLTSRPGPLSHAMPAHAIAGTNQMQTHSTDDKDKSNIGDKIKSFFRRSSTIENTNSSSTEAQASSTAAAPTDAPIGAGLAGSNVDGTAAPAPPVGVDPILDQTAAGDQLPSTVGAGAGTESITTSTTAGATAAQANSGTANAHAEEGFPGVIMGQRLVAITVPLHSVKKEIALGGGKKNEGNWVSVVVSSAVAGKAGNLKFEFDKDWLGGKAEAELLHHNLTNALEAMAEMPADVRFSGKPQGDANYVEGWQGNVRGKW